MKKLIALSALWSLILLTGCFDDSDTATVKINLGNIPVTKTAEKSIFDRFSMFFVKEAFAQSIPGDITAVYLGAVDNSNRVLESEKISASGFPSDNIVTFEVPAGVRRKIIVLGETSDGDIGYYGVSNSVDLDAGAVISLTIQMSILNESYIGLETFYFTLAEWNPVAGASKYNVYRGVIAEPVQSGPETSYQIGALESDNYDIEIVFGFSGKNSRKLGTYIS
jgi:hypothetical protein